MNKEGKVGIYIRLSLADEDTGNSKTESDSIGNQRMLINRFLDSSPELSDRQRLEFVDDGYTGTNFQRPQFQSMMGQIRAGEIDLICVKDFSRFSRDYIEMGNYLECVFPFLGVRFISVNDGYDSEDYKGTTGGLEVVMRSIVYAEYSKDLSIKTTTAKIQMMKQGKYVGSFAPYGYVLHPEVRNKLKPDPDAAEIVRCIFDRALSGWNTSQIAAELNRRHVPTPGQYFRARHPNCGKFGRMSGKAGWTASAVYKILTNYVYTGATIGHTRKSAGLGTKKSIVQERKDWIVVEGMHKAIVSKDEFEAAQSVIRGGLKNPSRISKEYPLKGLVRCGSCKRVMARRKLKSTGEVYYTCPYAANQQDSECAAGVRYMEVDLEQIAYHAIEQVISLAEKQAAQNKRVASKKIDVINGHMFRLRELQKQEQQLRSEKLHCYERYIAGAISKSDYMKRKSETDEKLSEITNAIKEHQGQLSSFEQTQSSADKQVNIQCFQLVKSQHLTSELARAFIKAIFVYAPDQIEIEWRFRDMFQTK